MSSNLRTSGSSKFQCKPTPECLHTFTYHGAFCLQPQDRRVIQGAVGCARSSVKNEQLNIGRVCFWRSCLHHLTYSNHKLERERNPGCNQQNCLSELMHPTIVWALKFWLNSASPMAQKKLVYRKTPDDSMKDVKYLSSLLWSCQFKENSLQCKLVFQPGCRSISKASKDSKDQSEAVFPFSLHIVESWHAPCGTTWHCSRPCQIPPTNGSALLGSNDGFQWTQRQVRRIWNPMDMDGKSATLPQTNTKQANIDDKETSEFQHPTKWIEWIPS